MLEQCLLERRQPVRKAFEQFGIVWRLVGHGKCVCSTYNKPLRHSRNLLRQTFIDSVLPRDGYTHHRAFNVGYCRLRYAARLVEIDEPILFLPNQCRERLSSHGTRLP